MKKIISYLAVGLLAVSLSGCFKSEAPKCSDSDVQNLVKKIYSEQVEKLQNGNPLAIMFKGAFPKEIVRIDSARPVKYEENINLRTCKAISYFDDNRSANIEYTVQLDEKNSDQFYVELKMDFLQGLATEGMMKNLLHPKR